MQIISVVGARPNFMKIAPFIAAIKKHNETVAAGDCASQIQHLLVHTGQHYDDRMSRAFFEALGIPDADINLGIGSGSHAEQVGRTMIEFEKVVREHQPDWVVVVGDVNATCACSITAKKEHVKLAHIEAGLRSFDLDMPEEINRMVTDRLSDLLFTPDRLSCENLRNEGVCEERIKFVGNIMIDTLEANRAKAEQLDVGEIIEANRLAHERHERARKGEEKERGTSSPTPPDRGVDDSPDPSGLAGKGKGIACPAAQTPPQHASPLPSAAHASGREEAEGGKRVEQREFVRPSGSSSALGADASRFVCRTDATCPSAHEPLHCGVRGVADSPAGCGAAPRFASPYALMTMHRPSNVDEEAVLRPIIEFLCDEVAADMPLIWPIHPRARKQLEKFGLWDTVSACEALILLHPLGYHELLRLNLDAALMLTDSGGLQEECCVLTHLCVFVPWWWM